MPANATVLVIAGPRTDLLQGEVDAIKQYLDRGGKLLVMLDPPDKQGQAPLTNLLALLKDWGIDAGNDVVVDTSGVGQLLGANEVDARRRPVPVAPHRQRFRVITAYPLARSIRPVTGGVNGRTAQTFVESSPQSWGESDLAALYAQKPVAFDKDKDVQGPVSLAAAVSVSAPKPPAAPASKPDEAKTPACRRAEAGNTSGRHRRLRFRLERVARHPGQSGPVPEHGRLAGAAGEPDLDSSA